MRNPKFNENLMRIRKIITRIESETRTPILTRSDSCLNKTFREYVNGTVKDKHGNVKQVTPERLQAIERTMTLRLYMDFNSWFQIHLLENDNPPDPDMEAVTMLLKLRPLMPGNIRKRFRKQLEIASHLHGYQIHHGEFVRQRIQT